MYFDWVSIHQQHDPKTTPTLRDGSVMCITETGEIDWVSDKALQFDGSFDTSVKIRCVNGLLEWSGNPSRYGRPDNVFGVESLHDALSIINAMLASFDLPGFSAPVLSPGTRFSSVSDTLQDADGAIITRLDLAQNYMAGSDAPAVLRALAQSVWHGHRGNQFQHTGVQWGSRRHTLIKWYNKGLEIQKHKSGKDQGTREYREKLASWCLSVGLLRYEIQLGRDALRRHGLRTLSEWDEIRAGEIMQSIFKKMVPSIASGGLSAIAFELEQMGHSLRTAQQMQGLAFQWASGVDVFAQFSPPTAYRYRKILRSVGIDIRQPLRDVTALRVQPRIVDLQPAVAPDWYSKIAA